jgi:hypothetical protein
MQSPQQPYQGAPGGGLSRLKIIGLVAGVVVLGVLGMFGNYARTSFFGSGRRGTAGNGQLGIDPNKADGDRMRTSVAGFATRWKNDAVWWGLTYSYVGSDGTMDLSKGGAVVQYVSLSSAKSFAKSVNQDAIKEFRFGATDVTFNTTTGVRDPKSWANAAPPAPPTCTIKQVAQALASKGLTPGKTVRITYDQQFAFAAPVEPSWHVVGEDPKIDTYYSMSTCAQTFASTH